MTATKRLDMVHATTNPDAVPPPTVALDDTAVNQLASRLALLPELALPASYLRATPDPNYHQRETYLRELLEQQPALFLERHVRDLTLSEREFFDPLRGDYEVNHWLSSVEESAKPSFQLCRNRRLAYMQTVLMHEGYFDEHEIFLRAPDVYEVHLGPYKPPRPDTSQPAALATWFLEQQDAAAAQERQRRRDADAPEEEEEDDEVEQVQPGDAALSERRPVPAELLDAMQQRFLCGLDGEHVDYSRIDFDAGLDEHFAATRQRDAEDAYFAEA